LEDADAVKGHRVLKRLFNRMGYVKRERLEAAMAEVRHARRQLESANQVLAQSRAETADWKRQFIEASKRTATLDREVRRLAKAQRLEDTEHLRDADRTRLLQEMHARMETAVRDLTLAREHLASVEVKLDIVEGAANVLDARTRTLLYTGRSGD
jgi:hypothetical protein